MNALRFVAPLEVAAAGATVGVGAWIAIDVILLPSIHGAGPQWTGAGMRAVLGHLLGWMLFGFVVALPIRAREAARSRTALPVTSDRQRTRIVILGGGFAGVTMAKALERMVGANGNIDVTLVSDTNALLFTPMLAEVAGGSLEASHISSPIRTALHRTTFARGRATAIDLERRTVAIGEDEYPYDHLVLALGAVSNYVGLANVERWALDFKTLLDAVTIRNRVIEMFERADRLPNASDRNPC